jgi:hypothetical protein
MGPHCLERGIFGQSRDERVRPQAGPNPQLKEKGLGNQVVIVDPNGSPAVRAGPMSLQSRGVPYIIV